MDINQNIEFPTNAQSPNAVPAFKAEITKRIDLFASKGEDTYLIYLNVDYMNAYNDSFGHSQGDILLQQIFSFLVEEFSLENIFRVGGDRFIGLIKESSGDALVFAESLRTRIDKKKIEHNYPYAKVTHVTVSIGVTQLSNSKTIDYPHVFRDSEESMIKAKESGRNCVVSCL